MKSVKPCIKVVNADDACARCSFRVIQTAVKNWNASLSVLMETATLKGKNGDNYKRNFYQMNNVYGSHAAEKPIM